MKKDEAGQKKPRAAGRIIGSLFLALVVLFTVYLSAVMLHRINTVVIKGIYKKVFSRELVICTLFLLAALDLRFRLFTRFRSRPLRVIGWLLRLVTAGLAVFVLLLGGRVIFAGLANDAGEADTAIVLGMALEDGRPTRDLLLRLDTAEAYAAEHPQSRLILTGGNQDEKGRTEAAVMKEILLERGLDESRIITEDQATDTKENFRNAAAMTDPSRPVVIVTSNYHMNRAVRIAGSAGFSSVMRVPAPSEPLYYGANVMWEVLMELNFLIFGR